MTILVTGASGHLGRLTVEALLARGVAASDIRAGARDVAKVADLAAKGVQTVHLDYTDAASVADAVAGVEKVLLVSGSELGQRVAQHMAVVDAAAAAGVAQLVYTSAPHATTSALILAPEHKATEEAIAASGVPATILRNNWYHENYLSTVQQAAATGVVASSTGAGRVASASRADFAEAAAAVLTGEGHLGKVYELGGDIAWDFAELTVTIGEVLGREIAYVAQTPEEQTAALTAAGLDAGLVGFLVGLDANIRDGLLAEVTGDLSRLIGRPTTPIADTLRAGSAA
ncbi:NAD(P)H-binding protein [Protaetiibacter intestinalis]|uniref:NAD-dependent epimerase/dehydratase family protein n=1 Tax=Protaetiibacter intestinalis TaxID=2419774 RepID=A0A387B9K1_9MICO|nr:NmrA family NAD(P)-binding protein [Protaetiibacter intestinalis]AYF97609.1 NAD-dependent epimerase/dehydratase family protein [Protaetiibacter intestinalis]